MLEQPDKTDEPRGVRQQRTAMEINTGSVAPNAVEQLRQKARSMRYESYSLEVLADELEQAPIRQAQRHTLDSLMARALAR